MPSIEVILGVHFFNGTVEEAVETMSANGGLLVVPAAPALVKLSEDEHYRRALTSADMVIADSGAMVLLWRIFAGRRVERISGLKFLKRLVARLASHPDERVLDPDTLLRISYLLGIFKALNSLHGQPLADGSPLLVREGPISLERLSEVLAGS